MRTTQTCSLPRVVGCGLSLFVVLQASGCFDDTSPVSPTETEVVVDAPTVDNATVEKGASFILSVTVRNDGSTSSPAITLGYYLSADTTISSSDTLVAVAVVAPLAGGASSNESDSLTAPSTPGTYYYGVCVDAVPNESEPTNNCSSAVSVLVTAPDLRIGSASVSDSEAAPGAIFTLSVMVSNDGEAASPATTLRYYLSTDATISSADTEVGTDAVEALAGGASSSESDSLTAPSTPGTYYYGVCVDAVSGESETTNNCSSAVSVEVRTLDLTVGSVSASPDSEPAPDATLALSVTVSNDGSASSPATTLRYYLSADTTITSSDTEVGTDRLVELAGGASSSESLSLTAPSTPGTYYYGVCVDAVSGESDTTNNCSSSVRVEVAEPSPATTPDLIVGSVSASPDSMLIGASFTLAARVSNDGEAASSATTLRYYFSADATIPSADTEVGTEAVAALDAGASSAEVVVLTAPSTPGTYYYGVCVDAVSGESDTTNNCSSSVGVEVMAPDLRVGSVLASPDSMLASTSFTLAATVSNAGTASSPATTLRYYLSADTTISSSDTEVGTDAVEALDAGASSLEAVVLTAPSTPGTYYYGVCVDAVSGESETTNTCSSSVRVEVAEPSPATTPDLIVGSVSASPDSMLIGASFTLAARVSNDGEAASSATTLRYYFSADATIPSADTEVGTEAVAALDAGASSAEVVVLTAPSTPGTYYYGVCVDAVSGESDTTNNCSSSVGVEVMAPDLRVGSVLASPDSMLASTSFTLAATVSNAGTASSPATTLRYYLSADTTISSSDTEVGTDAVEALDAGASSLEAVVLTAPSTPGTYYYGVCVDAVSGESETTNTCSLAVSILVTAPDLRVVSVSASPDSMLTGTSFTLAATVSNAGNASASATTLRYYLSADATISSSDTEVGTDAVEALDAGASSLEAVVLTAPSTAGTYYYGVCVDAVSGEPDTTNTCSSAVSVLVTAPDLRVVSVSASPDSMLTGTSFALAATVSNAGNASASATTLRYYLSADTTISSSDTEVGTDGVAALDAGASSAEAVVLTAPSTPGTYYYGVCVDAASGESDMTNNCSSAVSILVTAPDLIVGSVFASPDSMFTGMSFVLAATVSNDGTASSPATTLRYYLSADATISSSDTEVGTDAVAALDAGASSLEAVVLTAPETAGTYYYGVCVDAVSGESDTTNNCSSAERVVAIGPPDLTVGPLSAPDTVQTWISFRLTTTVSNVGDASSSLTMLRYRLSADTTISISDPVAAVAPVEALAGGASSAEEGFANAPSTAGTYYYGVCVDAVSGESETTNNCSSAVSVVVIRPRDLTVGSVFANPDSMLIGASFTLFATVSNDGDETAPPDTLRYYLSADTIISSSDTEVGTDDVEALDAGASLVESVNLTAASTAGTYYYGACVDAPYEDDTTNNCSSAVQVDITLGSSDLTVGSVTAKSLGGPGESFTLAATVSNAGDASASATTLRYYLSADATISSSDTEVASAVVAALAIGASSVESISVTAPETAGTYYYGVCVDAVSGESDTTNNCSSAVSVAVE